MIIVYIMGGIGNQLYQYATGRRLAHKLNTELKLDLTQYTFDHMRPYILNLFNIKETIATSEEIFAMKPFDEPKNACFAPEVLNCPDNIYLKGYWQHEEYFADIADILHGELTLKNPLGSAAKHWKEKILAAENSVSLHFRHGDFVYSPVNQNNPVFAIPPLDYYYECLNTLKREYKNLTLFVFSDNLNWCKEKFHSEFQTEFIEGADLNDVEELYLMSLCKHNIISKSTFSWWGAWLNQNPDKKVFMPVVCSNGKNLDQRYPAKVEENSLLDSSKWIRIPFDIDAQSSVTLRPYFSFLIVVNNDVDTIVESLGSLLEQDYKFFELIVIDNASTDGSGKICREVAKTFDNITYIKLQEKVQNGAAWNIALKVAQGYYVMFLKGNDRLLVNALTSLYLANEHKLADIFNSAIHLKEDENGDVDISGKKFVIQKISAFQNLDGLFHDHSDKPTLLKVLSSDEVPFPIETRIFKRKFLEENKIRFNEKIGDNAEILFVIDALFQTEDIIFTTDIFYIAP